MRTNTGSTSSSSPSTPTSASTSGRKGIVTLENVLSASKAELIAQFATCGFASPASSLTQTELQLAFLRAYGIDPKLALSVFVNAVTARQLQRTAEEASSVQANCTDLHSSLTRSVKDAVDALSAAQDGWKLHLQKTKQSYREVDQLQAHRQDQQRLLDAAAAPTCSAPCDPESSYSLRCTGLKEETQETEADLLQKVNDMLGQLSSKVEATGARRQGRSGARKGRAVIMSFDLLDDRTAVLRTKSQLSKIADLRSVSIDVVLSAEQQQQKNALWPVYLQAKQNGQRTFWRGCHLFINGQHFQDLGPPLAMNFEHMNGTDMTGSFPELSPSSCPAPTFPFHASQTCYPPSSFPTSSTMQHQHAQGYPQQASRGAGSLQQPSHVNFQHQQPQPQRQQFRNQIAHNHAMSATPLPMRP